MASYNAIAAISQAILHLLEDTYPRSEFGRLNFKLTHLNVFEDSGAALTDTFTLCLYRVGINGNPRNRSPRSLPSGHRVRPSLPVDLYYLLTPWAADVEKQQRMLGWGMRLLEDVVVLPAGELNRHLGSRNVFRPEEAIELIADPLTLQDWISFWDKLKPRLETSITYVVRAVQLDSEFELDEFPRVRERELRVGTVVTP